MSILTGLNLAAFTQTANAGGAEAVAMLAYLKTAAMNVVNDQKDAGGSASRFEYNMNVKQEQTVDFTVFMPNLQESPAEPYLTNTDITLWDIGGTAYLSSFRSGTIDVTTVYKEGSSAASAYKYPVAVRTKIQVATKKLVISNAAITALMMGGIAGMDVASAITFGGEAFTAPMTLKSSKHTTDREETQFEDVIMTSKGAATGPSDSSLLGNILLGTAQVALAYDTGGGQYNTAESDWALITKLTCKFEDGDMIEQAGQFMFQGPATYVTG